MNRDLKRDLTKERLAFALTFSHNSVPVNNLVKDFLISHEYIGPPNESFEYDKPQKVEAKVTNVHHALPEDSF